MNYKAILSASQRLIFNSSCDSIADPCPATPEVLGEHWETSGKEAESTDAITNACFVRLSLSTKQLLLLPMIWVMLTHLH
jgi:hypothetical protein